ncbi:MAG: hypothetical protein ACJ8EL_13515 [Rhizomicrobium sp.]|jgi:hypothetical protein
MDRNQLLAELRGHGNHLNITRSERPGDLAKGLGLLLLAFEQLLSGEAPHAEQAVEHLAAEPPAQPPEPTPRAKWQVSRERQPQTQIRLERNGGRLR